ncbi:MAG: class I SAM-dependent methyltransferase [Planctomycetes bacterium]|nr:class I SAM-dependent methyltransferase [Planctomycetota bacterium]
MNELAFALRSRLRWSRGRPAPAGEPKENLFDWLDGATRDAAADRAVTLETRHELGALRAASSRLVYAENLALLDGLEALSGGQVWPSRDHELRAIDIGSGSFQYATALQRWLAGRGRRVRLRGIEIDGHGIYRDGHSRADHATANAALAGPGVSFEVADFARLEVPPQDVVTMFYPFLSAFSLLRWGSPLSHLQPRRLLRRAVAGVRPGGWLLVANQTELEFERLAGVLAELPVTLLARRSFATDLVPYRARTTGRIGSLWRRNSLPEAERNG